MIETKKSIGLFDEIIRGSDVVGYDNVWDAMGLATLIFAVANDIGLLMPTGCRQS